MNYRNLFKMILPLLLLLAACAPEDLDITPTLVPSAVPTIKVYVTGAVKDTGKTFDLPLGSRVEDAVKAAGGAADNADLQRVNMAQTLSDGQQVHVPVAGEIVAETTPEPTATQVVAKSKALLDHIIQSTPGTFVAGTINWRQDRTIEVAYIDQNGGNTGRITFGEAGGGQMELTFGVFDTPDLAKAFYDKQFQTLKDQSQTEQRDGFPTPNAFGKGTYGSAAIFVRDNIFIKVSIPRFSSTAGEPLSPASKQIFSILDAALASFTG